VVRRRRWRFFALRSRPAATSSRNGRAGLISIKRNFVTIGIFSFAELLALRSGLLFKCRIACGPDARVDTSIMLSMIVVFASRRPRAGRHVRASHPNRVAGDTETRVRAVPERAAKAAQKESSRGSRRCRPNARLSDGTVLLTMFVRPNAPVYLLVSLSS